MLLLRGATQSISVLEQILGCYGEFFDRPSAEMGVLSNSFWNVFETRLLLESQSFSSPALQADAKYFPSGLYRIRVMGAFKCDDVISIARVSIKRR